VSGYDFFVDKILWYDHCVIICYDLKKELTGYKFGMTDLNWD